MGSCMRYHLNRAIRFATELEFSTLYKWSLQELSDDGMPASAKLIPWQWSLYFVGSELTLYRSIQVENAFEGDTPIYASGGERILVTLIPDKRGFGWVQQTSYSMFGTNRLIREFTLSVTAKGPTEAQRLCFASGWPSYTTNADENGPEKTTEDALWFDLSVPEHDFAALRNAIECNAGAVGLTFMVKGVDGFYAEWVPEVNTEKVKVLCAGPEQRVDVPPDAEQPPRLGPVANCNLQVFLRTPLAPPRIETANQSEQEDSPIVQEQKWEALFNELSRSDKRLSTSVEALQASVNRNRLPLWLLFVVALAILLYRVA